MKLSCFFGFLVIVQLVSLATPSPIHGNRQTSNSGGVNRKRREVKVSIDVEGSGVEYKIGSDWPLDGQIDQLNMNIAELGSGDIQTAEAGNIGLLVQGDAASDTRDNRPSSRDRSEGIDNVSRGVPDDIRQRINNIKNNGMGSGDDGDETEMVTEPNNANDIETGSGGLCPNCIGQSLEDGETQSRKRRSDDPNNDYDNNDIGSGMQSLNDGSGDLPTFNQIDRILNELISNIEAAPPTAIDGINEPLLGEGNLLPMEM
ncbi:uncharacterized protein LOC144443586 [Glandiceps talaboti]